MRKVTLQTLLGVVLVATAFVGCERRIVARDRTEVWIPPPAPTPANSLIVQVSGAVSDLNGVKVTLRRGSATVKETVIGAVTSSPATVQFDSISGTGVGIKATYQVSIEHTTKLNFTIQSALVPVVDFNVPVASFALQKIENSADIQVEEAVVDPVAPTVVTVASPPTVTQDAPTAAPAKVTIAPSSGISNVSVSNQTAATVPPIVENNVVSQAVIGAVQIQTTTPSSSAQFSVNIPLPIDSTQRAEAAAGGATMELLKYNVSTATWSSLGSFPVQPDGTVQADSLTGIDQNTIISLAAKPAVNTAKTEVVEPTPVLTADQVEEKKRLGDSTVTDTFTPTISASSGKAASHLNTPRARTSQGGGVGQLIPPPAGIPGWAWPFVAQIVSADVPVLRSFFTANFVEVTLQLPPELAEVKKLAQVRSWHLEFPFGALTVTIDITIDWEQQTIVFVVHKSGTGGG